MHTITALFQKMHLREESLLNFAEIACFSYRYMGYSKTVKNHLSVAQNGIKEVPPHTRRKTTKKWRKVSKKT